MFKFIFWFFILYLLYKFIFELVIPVTKATRNIRAKMQEQQQFMESNNTQQQSSPAKQNTEKPPAYGGDYIEFEEVKP